MGQSILRFIPINLCRFAVFSSGVLTLTTLMQLRISPAQAQMIPTEATILRVSRSKQSIILDRGHLDGWREGDYAVFLLRPNQNKEAHYYVGTGKLISQEGNASTWLFSELADKKALSEGSQLIVKNQRQSFVGRVDRPISQLKTIRPDSGDQGQTTSDAHFPPRSAMNEYEEENVQAPLPLPNEHSIGPMRVEEANWQKINERVGQDGEVKSVLDVGPFSDDRSREELQDLANEDEFYRQNEQDLQELQDPEFSIQDKYRESNRDPEIGDFSALTTTPNTYQKTKDYLTNQEFLHKREAKDLITQEGPDWSEHFTDGELSEFVNRTGLVTEQERQRMALETVDFHNDFSLVLGSNLSDSGNEGDTDNTNSSHLGFGLCHEIYLGHRWAALEQFAFMYGVFTQSTNLGLDLGVNGAAQESGIRAHALWYPWQNSRALNRPLFFLGAGLKRGVGSVKIQSSAEQASYTTNSLGELLSGMKFRISRRWGTKLFIEYVNTSWRKSDFGQSDVFPSEASNTELKIAAALSFYF